MGADNYEISVTLDADSFVQVTIVDADIFVSGGILDVDNFVPIPALDVDIFVLGGVLDADIFVQGTTLGAETFVQSGIHDVGIFVQSGTLGADNFVLGATLDVDNFVEGTTLDVDSFEISASLDDETADQVPQYSTDIHSRLLYRKKADTTIKVPNPVCQVYKGAKCSLGELHTTYFTVAVQTVSEETGSGSMSTRLVPSYDAAEDIDHITEDTENSPGVKAVQTADGSMKTVGGTPGEYVLVQVENPKKSSSMTNDDTCATSAKTRDWSYNTCISDVQLYNKQHKTVGEIPHTHVFPVNCSGSNKTKIESENSLPCPEYLDMHNHTIKKSDDIQVLTGDSPMVPIQFTIEVSNISGTCYITKVRAKLLHLTHVKTQVKYTIPEEAHDSSVARTAHHADCEEDETDIRPKTHTVTNKTHKVYFDCTCDRSNYLKVNGHQVSYAMSTLNQG